MSVRRSIVVSLSLSSEALWLGSRRSRSTVKDKLDLHGQTRHQRIIRPHIQRRLLTNRNDNTQKIPLSGYYADILSNDGSSQKAAAAKVVEALTSPPATPELSAEEEREARARKLFGSPRESRIRDREAQSTVVAGITIPPKPLEPDNCCMSGCVNCVWDLYREELEEYAAANAQVQAKLAMQRDRTKKMRQPVSSGLVRDGAGKDGRPDHVAVSMDDDGGGSDTMWDGGVDLGIGKGKKDDDLFANVPVGMREFMRVEKMLRQKRAAETKAGA